MLAERSSSPSLKDEINHHLEQKKADLTRHAIEETACIDSMVKRVDKALAERLSSMRLYVNDIAWRLLRDNHRYQDTIGISKQFLTIKEVRDTIKALRASWLEFATVTCRSIRQNQPQLSNVFLITITLKM